MQPKNWIRLLTREGRNDKDWKTVLGEWIIASLLCIGLPVVLYLYAHPDPAPYYEQGFTAGLERLPPSSCPYSGSSFPLSPSSLQREQWLKGWRYGVSMSR